MRTIRLKIPVHCIAYTKVGLNFKATNTRLHLDYDVKECYTQ